ncbi:hypothetical protein DAI22_01g280500 [Oryza sativa Japonica Group]|nr:hypothetical protein DAI22_01g280500 [Oryza sativa Japonica Group]
MAEANQYQILVRLLDGRTRCLRFSTTTVSGAALLDAVSALSRVPAASLRLVTGRLDVSPSSVLASSADGRFPSASALLRLRGGKGGFGSLLRGAASKAGQKKTSNFDACRDINGRRLRHVNAERRLEEWKAEAADRQLEKLAEDFIKKKVQEDESDSDSDSEMDDDEGADTKSIILDDGNSSHGSKSEDEKVDLGSITESPSEGETSGEKSGRSESEENGNGVQESREPTIRSEGECGDFISDGVVEHEIGVVDEHTPENGVSALSEEVLKPDVKAEDNTASASATSHLNDLEAPPVEEPANGNISPLSQEPLDLTIYSSAAELEVLGMERLKLELQNRGLKCGGTLQERAARLFLLKTTPLEKLPKKLFAKPSGGGK